MNSPFGTSLKKTDRTPARIIFRQDRLVPSCHRNVNISSGVKLYRKKSFKVQFRSTAQTLRYLWRLYVHRDKWTSTNLAVSLGDTAKPGPKQPIGLESKIILRSRVRTCQRWHQKWSLQRGNWVCHSACHNA